MSQNPAVLGLHFLLELVALGAYAYWGWMASEGPARWVLAIGLPVLAALAWSVLRSSVDPQPPMIEVAGIVRLGLELAILGGAALVLALAGQPVLAAVFAVLMVLDYTLSADRVGRLLGL